MTSQLTDLILVEYIVDRKYMLGAFRVKSEKTGEVFMIEPTDDRFVLYFDNELFCWMLDVSEDLKWDKDNKKWTT